MGASRPHWRLRRCVSRTGICILPSLGEKNNRPREGAYYFSGGERGIRTLEGLLTLTPLAGERFRPLSHLSEYQIVFESGAGSALTRAVFPRISGTARIRPAAHSTQAIGPGKA